MKRWVPLCVGVVAVVAASLVPVSVAPSPAQEAHAFSDLLWHATAYFALTALGLYAVSERSRRTHLGVVVGVLLLGAGVEVAQSFVAYRTASAADATANVIGTLVTLVVQGIISRLFTSGTETEFRQ